MEPEEWICGHCLDNRHRSCPGRAGCGCGGRVERVCQCQVRGHPHQRVIDLRDSVVADQNVKHRGT